MSLQQKAKQAEKEEEQPDFGAFLHPHGSESDKAAFAKPLITSDKDLRTKSRIPHAFVMSFLDMLPVWAEVEQMITKSPTKCPFPQCGQLFTDPEVYLYHRWGEVYREDGISEGGGSREEYTSIGKAPISFTRLGEETDKKMKEGSRK